MGIDYLAIYDWFICRIDDFSSSVLFCSLRINCSVVADVTDTSIRNTWLSRMEGVISTAYIVGPAIGAVLVQYGSRIPL